ncbi:MAG: hypothetical protein PHR81_09385, partial [Bacteroidales bacterium]|nr:hypothetical protein [Bacteroidales bacterium]
MFRRSFKPAYLLFLLFPLLYFVMHERTSKQAFKLPYDYFYFSMQAGSPVFVSLFDGNDSLASWSIDSQGYKYCDILRDIDDSKGLTLKIENLKAGDTAVINAFNMFRNGKLYSLNDYKDPYCTIMNAGAFKKDEALHLISSGTKTPIIVKIQSCKVWQSADKSGLKYNIIIIVFVVVLIFIFLIAPPVRHFVFSCLLGALLMMLFYFLWHNDTYTAKIISDKPVQRFETFCSTTPCFSGDMVFESDSGVHVFEYPTDIESKPFMRIDLESAKHAAFDLSFGLSSGVLNKSWKISDVVTGNLILNDLILKDGKYIVCGNDPYFLFTHAGFQKSFKLVLFSRQNMFLLASLLAFMILLSLHFILPEKFKNSLQGIHLLFIVIPAFWAFVTWQSGTKQSVAEKDKLYFSIKTAKAANIELFGGGKPLSEWQTDSLQAYKLLQTECEALDDKACLLLRLSGFHAGDTVSLLSMNYYTKGKVATLYPGQMENCRITNAKKIKGAGMDVLVENSNTPVTIRFAPAFTWHDNKTNEQMRVLVFFIFILVLIIIVAASPSRLNTIFATISATFLMLIVYFAVPDESGKMAVKTERVVRGVDIYYSNNPYFDAEKVNSLYLWRRFYKMDL